MHHFMTRIAASGIIALLMTGCATRPSDQPPFKADKLREIDAAISKAIADRKTPGGVFWIERHGQRYHRAYGNRALVPAVEAMTEETIYDVASLTKIVATTPSVWLLIERGRLKIDARVTDYIPELAGKGRDEITIRHLLTHTSGLLPDLELRTKWSGYDTAVRKIVDEETPINRPGYVFRYSDINFILLGEIVRRVSGEPLDIFAERELFKPLGMTDTRFRPPASDVERIAPTEQTEEGMLRGVVHDPTARRMGGVAGHAGLFTTAHDLARYARMLLALGTLDGVRILKPETVATMISVQSPPNVAERRAGGFDIDSGFARPRGSLFPIGSYGHTGWTGGFLWIDPFSQTFYFFLSNRVHPDGTGSVTALQVELGTLAAEAVNGFDFGHVGGALPPRNGGSIRFVTGGGNAANGIDVLVAERFASLRGLRIGLITNHTGIDKSGNPTIDLLRSAPDVNLVALFSPEHGIRGVADEKISDSTDPVSGLPLYSLFGERTRPAPEQLAGLDALVYDIQDIGARFYTYESTLGLAMEAAAEANLRFFVLDRVDPVGGTAVEGPLLEGRTGFVGYHPVVVRPGMTVGELALMYKDEKKLTVDLHVVKVHGWSRKEWQDEAGLPWIDTSPNIRNLSEAGLYPGVGLLERTNVSVGRGTSSPFEIFGAPYIDEEALVRRLTALHLTGVAFTTATFTPDASVHKGEVCRGGRIALTDRRAFDSVRTGIAIVKTLHDLYPTAFDLDKVDDLLRHPPTIAAIRAGRSIEEIVALWRPGQDAFEARRAKYLLYP
jgi:uncharacterized protein YbbC (DUF1343 family)/CubicO group peptidase (beta-lactamase class C family)